MTALQRPAIPTVVFQHLEDATALRSVRAVLVRAPHVKLLHLGRTDERLAAHLDGLSINIDTRTAGTIGVSGTQVWGLYDQSVYATPYSPAVESIRSFNLN